MCKFCDEQTYDTFCVMENDERYVNLKIENMGGEVRIIGVGDNYAFYHPKYCPECGRKLYKDGD